MAERRHTYETLDAMRGVAAVAVVVFHSQLLFGRQLAPSGYLAVDLFFVLSGFVLSHAYDGRAIPLGDFMRLRLVRLWPLYLLGLALAVSVALMAMAAGRATFTLGAVLTSAGLGALYIPSPFGGLYPGSLFPLNPPAWSLFFELAINAAFCTALFRRRDYMAVMMLAAAGALTILALNGEVAGGADWSNAAGGLARVCWSFPLGVALRRYAPRARFPAWVGGLVLAIVAAILLYQPARWHVAYDLGFMLVVSPLLVWIGSGCEVRGVVRSAYLWAGTMSYALYAVHKPLSEAAHAISTRLGLPPTVAGIGFVVGVVVLATVLDRAVDGPLRKRLNTWGRSIRASAAA